MKIELTDGDADARVHQMVDKALDGLFAIGGNPRLIESLDSASSAGLSFSELEERTGLNPASLDRQLGALLESALIENYLERRKDTKEYSFYRLTGLGQAMFRAFSRFHEDAIHQIVRLSSPLSDLRKVMSLEESYRGFVLSTDIVRVAAEDLKPAYELLGWHERYHAVSPEIQHRGPSRISRATMSGRRPTGVLPRELGYYAQPLA